MIIFLDMDGVLCDFATAAFAVHGQRYDPESYPQHEVDIATVLGVSTDLFWHKIHDRGEAFWAELEPYPWANDLVNYCAFHADVIIATKPSRHKSSYSGKRTWLDKMGFDDIPAMFGGDKHLLAAPGRILIDDMESNLSNWAHRGGIDIRFPQPWNVAGFEPTYGDVMELAKHACSQSEQLL